MKIGEEKYIYCQGNALYEHMTKGTRTLRSWSLTFVNTGSSTNIKVNKPNNRKCNTSYREYE